MAMKNTKKLHLHNVINKVTYDGAGNASLKRPRRWEDGRDKVYCPQLLLIYNTSDYSPGGIVGIDSM